MSTEAELQMTKRVYDKLKDILPMIISIDTKEYAADRVFVIRIPSTWGILDPKDRKAVESAGFRIFGKRVSGYGVIEVDIQYA